MKKFSNWLLKLMGYQIDTINIPPEARKCVLVFAPHTSLSDFPIGWLSLKAMGVKTNFVMKKEAFFFPVKYLFKAMGAIPVDRQHGTNFPSIAADIIRKRDEIAFLIAPEGTRTRVDNWKRGFYIIAQKAQVPIVVGYLDYRSKRGGLDAIIYPSGDYEKDLEEIQKCYYGMHGYNKGQFNLEDKPYVHPEWLKK